MMKFQKTMKAAPWIGGLVLTAALSSAVFAQNNMMTGENGPPAANATPQAPANAPVQPYGYGPGMMYGYGPMMGHGYGPGGMRGYGPGMMSGYGMGMHGYGPGAMMYGYGPMMGYGYGPGGMRGYGPGMMSGYGMGMHGYGPGAMMYGYGPGMMYGYGQGAGRGLNLNAKQRQALHKMWKAQAARQPQLRAQLYQDMSQMQELMAQKNPDPQAVGKIYDRMAKTRRQMLINGIEMRNKFENTLTPEQRMRWRQSSPWCPGNVYQDNDD